MSEIDSKRPVFFIGNDIQIGQTDIIEMKSMMLSFLNNAKNLYSFVFYQEELNLLCFALSG